MNRLPVVALALSLAATVHAGQILLPTTLDTLLPAGNFFVVAGDRFDAFAYDNDGVPPAASAIQVRQFLAGDDHGFTLHGGFATTAEKKDVDYRLAASVHGTGLVGASLSGEFMGTGSGTLVETLLDAANGSTIGVLEISSKGPNSDSLTFATPFSGTMFIRDEVILNGSNAAICMFSHGFRPTTTPGPGSITLLATGLVAILLVVRERRDDRPGRGDPPC